MSDTFNVFDPEVYGEPVYTDTLFDTDVYGELLDDESAATNVFGQAQAFILQNIGYGFGQAQGFIDKSKGLGQAQADIKQIYQGYSQAQALIIPTRVYGQAQADIKATYQGYAQSQAKIKQTYQAYGQANARIHSLFLPAPFFVAAGTEQSGTGVNVTVPWPTHQINDIALMFVESNANGGVPTLNTANGFVTAGVGAVQIGSGFSDTMFDVFWCRATSSSQASPIINNTGDHIYAQILTFRGVKETGNPWSMADADNSKVIASTVVSVTGVLGELTKTNNNLVVFGISRNNDASGAAFTNLANTSLTAGSELVDGGTTVEFGGGFAVYAGQRGLSGSNGGTLTGTVSPSVINAGQIIALTPAQVKFGQAQALIIPVYNGYGQAEGYILQTLFFGWGQAQADIKQIYFGFAQAQATLGATIAFAQAQAFISKSAGYGQAQAKIRFGPVIIEDLLANAHTYTAVEGATADISVDFTTYSSEVTDADPFYEGQFPADGTWDSSYGVSPNGWFYLTLLQRQIVEIDTLKFAQYTANDFDPDTVLGIFTGVSGPGAWESLTHSGTIHQGSDDATTTFVPGFTVFQSKIKINLAAGTYLFIVGQYDGDTIHTFNVHLGVHAPQGLGQAQAKIRAFGVNRHAQAQAFIVVSQGYGQAQAFIDKAEGFGQAQGTIKATGNKFGQARAKIVPYLNAWAQSNADIKAKSNSYGQAQARIVITKASGQAQAIIKVNNSQGYAQAQAQVEREKKYAQAQAYIKGTRILGCGQAQAFILKRKGHGQAQARIKLSGLQQYAQAQARIKHDVGYGQAQARIKQTYNGFAQAQALLPLTISPFGQAQAYISNSLVFGQANADILVRDIEGLGQAGALILQHVRRYAQTQGYIKGLGQQNRGQAQGYITRSKRVHGQAQAYIRTTGNFKFGQVQAFIVTTRPVGQAQAVIATERYLAKFNGYQLPGYVQEESIESIIRIKTYGSPYRDFSFSEYEGLENKNISLRILVVGENYLDCKNQIELAGTLVRTKKSGFADLYIQYHDRHFEALTKQIRTEASVANIKTSEYSVEFETKPWIISDTTTTISGTSIIETVGRTIDDGGWTPVIVETTGTDVTVSGYTATGDFTGFVSVSGLVVDYTVDNQELFVGPGVTYFEVTGATDCTITYNDRWYL